MSDKSMSEDSNLNEPTTSDSNEGEQSEESVELISEEEGLKSAEKFFKAEFNEAKDSNSSADEDKEFYKKLSEFAKNLKDLGLEDLFATKIYYGGNHFKNSNVENYGNVVGSSQTNYSKTNSGDLSEEINGKSQDSKEKIESIESVFDECEDIKQRSFMIALAALNGCNYRTVVKAAQRFQSILQPKEEVETEV